MEAFIANYDLNNDADYEEIIEAFGLYEIGRGAQRTVYGSHEFPYVIKEDRWYKGGSRMGFDHGNYLEAMAYANLCQSGLSEYCAEVIGVSISGKYLMMRKVDTSQEVDYRSPEMKSLRTNLEHFGVTDLHTQNVGWIDGRLVAIDMGLTFYDNSEI